MNSIVNFSLLSHPANWIIIFLTLYLVALLAKLLYGAITSGVSPIPLPNIG